MECLISLLSFEKQNKNKKKETHTRRLHVTSNIINNRLLMESLNALFKHNLTECSP